MKAKQGISRRDFLKQAGLAGAGLLLAACGSGNQDTEPEAAMPDNEPVELDVWTGWTEDAATNIENILAGYNESQDRITANHVVVPEAMTQKLLAAVAADNSPAAAIVFGANVAYQLAAQDGVLSLQDVGNPDDVSALEDWMDPALWDLGVYEGKFVYASMWNQCLGVFVNTDFAEAQGVDPNDPPQSLQALDEVYDQLTTYDDNGNIDVLGGDFTWNAMIMGRFLGQFVESDGKTITANHPNNLAALQWLTNRWQEVGPQKLQDFYASLQGRGERSAGQDPFLSGLRATYVTGPWQYNTIINFKPEDFHYTVWPYPGPEGQSKKGMYTYGDGWIVPRGSKDPQAAWEIIGTMTGATGDKDVYTSLFTTWQCVNGPVSSEMEEWPKFQNEVIAECPGYQDIFLRDLFDSDQYLYPPKIPTSDSYMSIMSTEWEKSRLGEKTPQEALDFVQEQAQAELDEWLAQQG
jgi:multiple sugar transport system substrate-binding protein